MAKTPVLPQATLREIKAAWLFSACNDDEITTVAALCRPLAVPAGHVITRAGDPGDECFIVASGRATGTRGTRTLGHYFAGSIIAPVSLVVDTPHAATVRAETGMRLFALDRSAFTTLRAHGAAWSVQHRLDVMAAEQQRMHTTMPIDIPIASGLL
jgi:CRP-like cAMP-binding protein